MADQVMLRIVCIPPDPAKQTNWREWFPDDGKGCLDWLMSRLDAAVDHALADGPLGVEAINIQIVWPKMIPRAALRALWRQAALEHFSCPGNYDPGAGPITPNPFHADRPIQILDEMRQAAREAGVLEVTPERKGAGHGKGKK